MTPLLSVILANKNRNHLLDATLNFWRQQHFLTPEQIELIVADDGSDIMPVAVCEKYRARLILLPSSPFRKNPATAWNAGLRASIGQVKACTHAEIVPSHDCARYLYGICMGDAAALEGLTVWAPAPTSPDWDKGVVERPLDGGDIRRLQKWAVRANVVTFRLAQNHQFGADPENAPIIYPDFWVYETDFGGHTNHEILNRFRGFFWNNLFALRAETWEWMNYHRESRDWGMDDEDFQRRNQLLQLAYLFTDDAFAYHQWHGPEFRGGSDDHFDFKTLEDARLLHELPDTFKGREFPLKRGPLWRLEK